MLITRPFASVPVITSVVSSSVAGIASVLTATVNSASMALTPVGPIGPSGSSSGSVGASGSTGPMGPSGSSGSGVYLLTGSRSIIGGDCYTVEAIEVSQSINWTDMNNAPVTVHIAYTTKNICVASASGAPSGGSYGSVTYSTTPCYQLHTNIADATAIPCTAT